MSVIRGSVQEHLTKPSAYKVDAIAGAVARLDFNDAAARMLARAASGEPVSRAIVTAMIDMRKRGREGRHGG